LHAQGHHVHTATAADGPTLGLLDALVLGDLLLLKQLLLLLLLLVHPIAHKIYLKKRKRVRRVRVVKQKDRWKSRLTCAAAVVAADNADVVVVAGLVGVAVGTGHTNGAAPQPRRDLPGSLLLLGIWETQTEKQVFVYVTNVFKGEILKRSEQFPQRFDN